MRTAIRPHWPATRRPAPPAANWGCTAALELAQAARFVSVRAERARGAAGRVRAAAPGLSPVATSSSAIVAAIVSSVPRAIRAAAPAVLPMSGALTARVRPAATSDRRAARTVPASPPSPARLTKSASSSDPSAAPVTSVTRTTLLQGCYPLFFAQLPSRVGDWPIGRSTSCEGDQPRPRRMHTWLQCSGNTWSRSGLCVSRLGSSLQRGPPCYNRAESGPASHEADS